MSSINLDLDFQEYAPTSGASNSNQPQQSDVQIKIPLHNDSGSSNSNPGGGNTILNLLQNFQSNQPASGLSEETLQQLIQLSRNKQRNKQQQRSTSGGGWGLGILAQYFDVTSTDVLQRILWSAVPVRKVGIDLDDLSDPELTEPLRDSNLSAGPSSTNIDNDGLTDQSSNKSLLEQLGDKRKFYSYMERFIQSRPDLYGPFWISATLIFAVAIFSNIVSFRNYRDKFYHLHETNASPLGGSNNASLPLEGNLPQIEEWHYSVDELNMTASLVMFYVTLLPTFLWFLFWFRGCTKYYTLTETICGYGYSLSIFVPLSFLLMIQAALFRYIAISIASISSGLVLVMSFLPMIHSDPNKGGSHIILVIVFACQVGLAYVLHRIMLL